MITDEVLQEDNYIKKINSYTLKDWNPLLELIPEIEKTSKFGELRGGEEVEKGVFQLPYYVQNDIVSNFTEIVYEMPIAINFDWGSWYEGREMLKEKDFDFDSVDIPTKCKLITAIIRSDRFCDGVLVDAFNSGIMLKILKSIKGQMK